ncbi:MAG TPA: VTT domain-containing protein, partial [Defluviicoccus sp.]|nr:VTT domain-containing protein [Defluviicoccus sp.]
VGDGLRARAGPFVKRMEEGFRRDAFNYLLFLRLVPVFPFWVVNLVPAFLGMRLIPYVIATLIGIIPGGVVYTAFGAGLGDLFDAGAEANLKDVFTPTIILALVGLGVLALVPIAVRRWRERTRPPVDTV